MLEQLIKQLEHWDKEVRDLAAQSLCRIAEKLSDTEKGKAAILSLLTTLMESVRSPIPQIRHGSILGIAYCLYGSALWIDEIDASMRSRIVGLITALESERLFRGSKGELVRDATCKLIEVISKLRFSLKEYEPSQLQTPSQSSKIGIKAALPHKKVPRIVIIQTILDDSLAQPHEFLQKDAAQAIKEFTESYYARDGKLYSEKYVDAMLDKYISGVCTTQFNTTRGYALALGVLPSIVVAKRKTDILTSLIKATTLSKIASERDVETRRNAVIALRGLAVNCCLKDEDLKSVVLCLVNCLNDFATDTRGDVGSWVREQALEAIKDIVLNSNFSNEGILFVEHYFHE